MRSGALAGVAVLGARISTATATTSTALDPARRATFASLAELVLTGPAYRLDASAAQTAANDFAKNFDRMLSTAEGAGATMTCQYLLHTDPNYDSGLCDTPETGGATRPAYATLRALPSWQ